MNTLDFDLLEGYARLHKEERIIIRYLVSIGGRYFGTITKLMKLCGYTNVYKRRDGTLIPNIPSFRNQGLLKLFDKKIIDLVKCYKGFSIYLTDNYTDIIKQIGKE